MNRYLGILLQTLHFPIHDPYKYPNSTVSTPHNPHKKKQRKRNNKPTHYLYESFVPCHGRANQEQKKKRRARRKASHGVQELQGPTGTTMTVAPWSP